MKQKKVYYVTKSQYDTLYHNGAKDGHITVHGVTYYYEDNATYNVKEPGKGLSQEDFTSTLKNKLEGISYSADAVRIENLQTSGDAIGTLYINNTPHTLYVPPLTGYATESWVQNEATTYNSTRFAGRTESDVFVYDEGLGGYLNSVKYAAQAAEAKNYIVGGNIEDALLCKLGVNDKAKSAEDSDKLGTHPSSYYLNTSQGYAKQSWVQNEATAHNAGLLNNKAESALNVNNAHALRDASSGAEITAQYSGQTGNQNPSYYAVWNNYQITFCNRENVKSNIGLGNVRNVASYSESESNSRYPLKDEAIKEGDALLTTNPFGGRQLYISKIDNALFRADKRWDNISYKEYTTSGSFVKNLDYTVLFDGSYETGAYITAGNKGVLDMHFEEGDFGYPYGAFYLSFYYNNTPASISARLYNTYEDQGVGWHTLTPQLYEGTADPSCTAVVYKIPQGYYYGMTELEITINARSNKSASMTQLEFQLERPNPRITPFVSKYSPETLYSPLKAPTFVEGNLSLADKYLGINNKAKTAGTADKVAHNLTINGAATGSFDGHESVTVTIPTIAGEPGRGITKVEKTGTSGLVDTYTITYNKAPTTSTFKVTNGKNGNDGGPGERGPRGYGVGSVTKKSGSTAAGQTVTYSVKQETTGTEIGTFDVYNGKNGIDGGQGPIGPQGPAGGRGPAGIDGRSITSITAPSNPAQPGHTDTYTINYSKSPTTSTFKVYNGKNGTNGTNGTNGSDGERGPRGYDVKSVEYQNTDSSGGRVYKLRDSNGSYLNNTFTAPKGPKGDKGDNNVTMSFSNGTLTINYWA